MHSVWSVLLIIVGILAVAVVLDAAVRTFVVPRGAVVLFTVVIFRVVRRFFLFFASERRTYEQRDRVMALYAPIALLALPFTSCSARSRASTWGSSRTDGAARS